MVVIMSDWDVFCIMNLVKWKQQPYGGHTQFCMQLQHVVLLIRAWLEINYIKGPKRHSTKQGQICHNSEDKGALLIRWCDK